MSDVRWEPVEDHEELVGMGFDAIFGPRPDGTLTLLTLPPDVRLCRAVPVTWSQEPPTENEAAVWLWHPQFGVAKGVVYWDRGIPGIEITGGPFIECAAMPEAWYARATVPQPPEVTP